MSAEQEEQNTGTQPLRLQKKAETSPRLTTLLTSWFGGDILTDRKKSVADRTAEEQYGEELRRTGDTVAAREDLSRDYELHEEIARGGHGMIRRATDRLLGRETAIKTLLEGLPDQEESRRAFLVEAKIMAQLDHPAVVPVYGVCGGENGTLHMAMKLVRGKTLQEYLAGLEKVYRRMSRSKIGRCERLALSQRLEIFLSVCSAISYVHFRGVIHRDLKPENIMIGNYNETYVMDWGIAEYRLNGERYRGSEKLQGTPQYIAPEVINRRPYDSRADIYALGLILFELVYLHPAYEAPSVPATIELAKQAKVGSYRHQFGFPVNKDLEMIIRKALAPDPDQRYRSVKMLAGDLRRWREGEEVSAYPDNSIRRMLRDMRHHIRLVGTCAASVIALLFSFGGCIYYREAELRMELQKRNEEQAVRIKKREALFSTVFRRGAEAVSWLNGRFYQAENLLNSLARETALMLESMPESPRVTGVIYPEEGAPAPKGVVFSATYGYPVDFDHFVCKTAGPVTPEMQKQLRQLTYLKDSFFRVLAGSSADRDNLLKDPQNAVRIFRDRKRPPVTRAYAGLANGMHLGYPCHFLYRKDYDPRDRHWYKAAQSSPQGLPVWSAPYFDRSEKGAELIISCSREIRDSRGKFLGVAGVDMSFDSLIRDMQDGVSRPNVEDGFLLDSQGRILCSLKNGVMKDAEDNSTASPADFHDREVWKAMQGKPNGTCFGEWNGHRVFYYFARLRASDCYFVVMLNYEKWLLMEGVSL